MLRAILTSSIAMFVVGQGESGAPALPPKLTPAKVVETFMTNEAFADEHYVGKELELMGKVVRVSRSNSVATGDRGGHYVLELDQEKAGRAVKLDLDLLLFFNEDDRKQLADLKPGQTVLVRGKCSQRYVWSREAGKRDKEYNQVEFRDCKLVGEK